MIPALHTAWLLVSLWRLAQQAVPPGPDDNFGPFLLLLGFLVVCLILIGVGIVLALAGMACVAALMTAGILSVSALVAVWRRQVAAGVRAFHYQVCAVLGVPSGIVGLWIASALSGREASLRWIILPGSVAGCLMGLVLAAAGDWTLRTIYRRRQNRVFRGQDDRPS